MESSILIFDADIDITNLIFFYDNDRAIKVYPTPMLSYPRNQMGSSILIMDAGGDADINITNLILWNILFSYYIRAIKVDHTPILLFSEMLRPGVEPATYDTNRLAQRASTSTSPQEWFTVTYLNSNYSRIKLGFSDIIHLTLAYDKKL